MQSRNIETFKWKDLYVAKMNELESKARKIEEQIVQSYRKEKTRKQNRQIIFCNKNPKCNRRVGFESNTSESEILKKAKGKLHMVSKVPSWNNKKRNFERVVGSKDNILRVRY